MKTSFNKTAQGGFTLIELIVVIVILGILAATALPKFANLSGDARAASVQGAKGAISAASAMMHAKYLITNTTPIVTEGVSVAIVNGYPSAATVALAAGISADDYKIDPNGQTLTVSPKGLPAGLVDTCKVTYTEANGDSPVPVVKATVTKCE